MVSVAQDTSINSTNIVTPSITQQNESAPLYSNSQDNKNLRIIIYFFSVVTAIVSMVLFIQMKYGDYQVIPHGSVTSDNERCSMIGAEIMQTGGNAVDAAIATTFCISVVSPHLTGIGGGGLMLIYDHRQGQVVDSIDFRIQKAINNAVGVPGFVAGLWLAHSLYGTLPWSKLLAPSIYLAQGGYQVSRGLMDSKQHVLPNMSHNLALKSWLSGLVEEELITNQELARTLQLISDQGGPAFYNSTLAIKLSNWLPSRFIASYQAKVSKATRVSFQGYNVLVSGPGSGGPYLIDSLSRVNSSSPSLVMSLSTAFSENQLDAWPVVSGASVSATDSNDLFVSLVSGLGSILGAQFLTSDGYLLNNGVENVVQSVLQDGEFVPSLSTPIVMAQADAVCGRRFVFGAGDVRDGLQTLLSLVQHTHDTQTALNNPSNNASVNLLSPTTDPSNTELPKQFASPEDKILEESIEAPRVRILGPHIAREMEHPAQLSPRELLTLQSAFNLDIAAPLPYPSANVIEKIADSIHAYSDSRGSGKSLVF